MDRLNRARKLNARLFSSLLAVILLITASCLSACGSSTKNKPLVVVTTNILGDVVTQLVGDQADVLVLMKANADPHSFEISAKEAARLQTAELIISNGLGLEEGLAKNLEAASNRGVPTFVAGQVVDVRTYAAGGSVRVDDPHFWTSPAQMIKFVAAAEEALVKHVKEVDRGSIRSNTQSYLDQLSQLESDMRASFAKIPTEQRKLVTNHHVFGYLAHQFSFTVLGAVIPSGTTLAAPSAADLRDLASTISRANVKTIFAESSQPDRLVKVLAKEAGVHVAVTELFSESLSAPGEGAETYLTMMRTNTERITLGLAP